MLTELKEVKTIQYVAKADPWTPTHRISVNIDGDYCFSWTYR